MAPTERSSGAPFRLGYRPGLDGLRGLGLIVVTLFHAQVPGIRAGHVGLTIFFVLSAFLITVLTLQERRDVGHVHLGRFYLRRMLRIHPALVLFILAVGAYVQLTATAPTARAQWLAGVSTLAGLSNLQHIATEQPLLLLEHTWSIAVELQFYLLWPPVLLWAVARGTSWRRMVEWMLGIAVAVLLIRTFWWQLTLLPSTDQQPLETIRVLSRQLSFHRVYPRFLTGTDLRLDHLLIGCVLGVVAANGHLERLRPYRQRLVAAAGGAMAYLVWFVAFVDVRDKGWLTFLFSGGSTLVAVAAAVVIATCILAADSPVPRFLANRVFVWLGTISYGVYLWHVPIFRIMRERLDWPVWQQASIGSGAAIALALLSYHLLEKRALAQKRRFEPVRRRAELSSADAPATVSG